MSTTQQSSLTYSHSFMTYSHSFKENINYCDIYLIGPEAAMDGFASNWVQQSIL